MASPTPSPTAPSPTTSSSSPPPAATPPTSSPSTPSPPPPSSTSSPPSPPSSSTKSRPLPPSSSSSKSPPPPPSSSMSTSSSGISTVVVGIANAVAAVLVSFCLCWKKRRERNDHCVPPPPPGYNSCNSTQGPNLEMKGKLEDVTTGDNGASSSTAPGSTYEVFLSFRGPDIRLGFTDHLYHYLIDVGVQTFRDSEELRVGEEIGPDLKKAIEESSISIPIFSKGYASSKWCLREVTHMVKCMNDIDPEGRRRHTVCPIFYDVTPEHVKRQTGSFAEAFVKHTKEVDACTVLKWKDALKEVGKLKGWEKDKIADGR